MPNEPPNSDDDTPTPSEQPEGGSNPPAIDLTIDEPEALGVGGGVSITEVDLAKDEPNAPIGHSYTPVAAKYDHEKHQDWARILIALVLLSLLAAPVVFPFIMLSLKLADASDIKELQAQVLTPVVALVGTVIGFYFAGDKSKH